MYELSVKTHFSAAHYLRGYDGKCADRHGHNWEVEIFVAGEKLNAMGILIDFRQLKDMLREELGVLDHADLNGLEAFAVVNPTSENIARYICERLSARMAGTGCRVSRVSVRETPETASVYTPDK